MELGFHVTPLLPGAQKKKPWKNPRAAQEELAGARSFFSELLSSMSDLKFSGDGRYMLARDFMALKLWDLHMERAPVACYPIHEHLRHRVRALNPKPQKGKVRKGQ
jgi:hypothetical protein